MTPPDHAALQRLAEQVRNGTSNPKTCGCKECRLARGVLALLADVARLREENARLRDERGRIDHCPGGEPR